jgi:hypothetical protein
LLECVPAWEGNWTWDCFLAFAWQGGGEERLLVVVNYAPNQSQCYVKLPFTDLGDHRWRLRDLMSPDAYDRDGNDLQSRGLYLDVPPWHASVYSLEIEPVFQAGARDCGGDDAHRGIVSPTAAG